MEYWNEGSFSSPNSALFVLKYNKRITISYKAMIIHVRN
jgi:hypothetical protein